MKAKIASLVLLAGMLATAASLEQAGGIYRLSTAELIVEVSAAVGGKVTRVLDRQSGMELTQAYPYQQAPAGSGLFADRLWPLKGRAARHYEREPYSVLSTSADREQAEIVLRCESNTLAIEKTIKTLVVHAAEEGKLIALIVRGDHTLNEIKAANLPQVASPLSFATDAEIQAATGAYPGSLGPKDLAIPCIVDRSVQFMSDFAAGANQDGKHYFGLNWERDLPLPEVADLRNVVAGDPSPCGKGVLEIKRGIEVGHIFQLGTKYSEAMGCTVMGENGKPATLTMGCYGIGVSRVVAAAIEQNHDERGIIWPDALAPFQVALIPMKYEKEEVRAATDALYQQLTAAGIEVLLDDRDRKTSPGVKFADMELMGIPHRIVVSDKGIAAGSYEYKGRRDSETTPVPVADVLEFLQQKMG